MANDNNLLSKSITLVFNIIEERILSFGKLDTTGYGPCFPVNGSVWLFNESRYSAVMIGSSIYKSAYKL